MERRSFLQTAASVAMSSVDAKSVAAEWEATPGSITDVHGIRVGHFTDARRPTGCTVVLFDEPAVCGVDVRGSAPGTRETDLLNPINIVEKVNAILLSGGSAYGLDAASGVMHFLEERNIGFRVGDAVVPIVPAAILFDLFLGDPKIHPGGAAGYTACQAAANTSIAEGSVGAGAGATVGKLFGLQLAMKSGIGTASWTVPQTGLVVGALVAVNAAGDVVHQDRTKILAGARNPDGPGFLDSMAQLMNGSGPAAKPGTSTTLGIVATNAVLSKVEVTKVAQMAHDGLARSINPVHTLFDGDTIFAAATGRKGHFDAGAVGAIAAEVVARAVQRAAIMAVGVEGYPARRELTWAR
ncbi:MAG: P1 family peptidase [Acidobacteriaceae bacterium]|nr:P1 family peptidase [Acidobacteriaceae bacterium]